MPDDHCRAAADRLANRAIDRRTVLAGAAGALLGMKALNGTAQAGAPTSTPETTTDERFDPTLADQLQQILDDVVASSNGTIPGAILHVERAGDGNWTGTAGLGQLDPDRAIRPEDRLCAGSIVKPFVSTAVLQLVEAGHFTLQDTLPSVLPADVTDRFPSAPQVTIRMLLGHRSGLPDWSTADTDATAALDPTRIWKVSEFLDLASAQEPVFPPGTDYAYSNTNYTLLGLVIEQATGRSWRDEVTDRVITPLGLQATTLPAPGNRVLPEPHAHGYMEVDGKRIDATAVDPSMAGAAGGHALVTTVGDLVRFLDALLAGRLFQHEATLKAMLDFQPAAECATCEPGQIGYGLGLLQRAIPGGVETIDHLGGAGGYFMYVAHLPRQQVTLAAAINSSADPSPLLLPVLGAFASAVPPAATPATS